MRFRVLGGSWVVIGGVISPLIWVITIVTLLITPLITPHEPPSTGFRVQGLGVRCRVQGFGVQELGFRLGCLGINKAVRMIRTRFWVRGFGLNTKL